jgi:hypothetical protein
MNILFALLAVVSFVVVLDFFFYMGSAWRILCKKFRSSAHEPGESFGRCAVMVEAYSFVPQNYQSATIVISERGILFSRKLSLFRTSFEIPWAAVTNVEVGDSYTLLAGKKTVIQIKDFQGYIAVRREAGVAICKQWGKRKENGIGIAS